jgi:uncharacterized DUF497 family protein
MFRPYAARQAAPDMIDDSHAVHTSDNTLALFEVAGFDWGSGNRPKCGKHGVPLQEIEAAFRGPMSVFPDLAHSTAEARHFGIGRIIDGRHVFVAFTIRRVGGRRKIRPISARFMHQEEISHYETQAAKAKV